MTESREPQITNVSDEELDQVAGGATTEEMIGLIEQNTQQTYAYKPLVSDTKPV